MTEIKSVLKELRNLLISLRILQRFTNTPGDQTFSKKEFLQIQSKNINKLKDNLTLAWHSFILKQSDALSHLPQKFPNSWKSIFVRQTHVINRTQESVNRKDATQNADLNCRLTETHDLEKAIKDINECVLMYFNSTEIDRSISSPNIDSSSNELNDNQNVSQTQQSSVIHNQSTELSQFKKNSPSISKSSLDYRTRGLVKSLKASSSNMSKLVRTEELCQHLLKYPEIRSVAIKEKAIPCLLRIQNESKDRAVQMQVRETLALLGYVFPVKGRGIRILSIDGGGTRGVIGIELLRKLEAMAQQPIWELFDYMCGVSTGAVLALMIGALKTPLDDCEEIYKKIGYEIFQRSTIIGAGNLLWNHAFYDTNSWINVLRSNMGEKLLIETASELDCPKIAIVSAVVNQPRLQPFLFRNYNLPSRVQSHYNGNCHYKMWEAIRASAAAPGYFEECKLDNLIHQDGGLLTNNPSALAIHESKLLWPNDRLQCVISLGNGRYEPSSPPVYTMASSIKDKLAKILASATDTEGVHTVLQDLLPPSTYFRFNPYMSENFQLDENQPDRIKQLQHDAHMYIRKNEHKLQTAVQCLKLNKTVSQKGLDWLKIRSDMIM